MKRHSVFDYVVVGAGSAGCVLANRLTADGSASVVLIEAGGPDDKKEIHIPAAFSKLFKSACDWAYFTEEQSELDNRRLYWPRGKVLGGSSSMNAMIYTRGHRHDFDEWAEQGNEGWSFAEVVPEFRRAECHQAPAGECGTEGPLRVSALRTVNPLTHAFVDACGQSGIARNGDFNGAAMEGAGVFRVTQQEGKRCSCAVAYLKPALSRKNLTVITRAHATRVLFDGTRAIGVEYVHDGAKHAVHAAREVILSGGAINSPQLLMLSGVGPADDLRRIGIGVVADLPGVGANLQDHLSCGVAHECTKPITLGGAESIGNLVQYLFSKKGMLTSNVAEAGAFLRMSKDAPSPDIELIFGPVYYMSHGFENPKGHGFSVGAILMHPKSRGTIRLRSADPFAAPAVDPRYFTDASDRRLLVDGVKLCLDVARSKAFDAYRGKEVLPATEAIEPYVRRHAETMYHPAGTCSMGRDDLAVVDSRLRVRGVEHLRVADASIMPRLITGHPNAAVVMIAEKAAEMIRGGA